MGLSYVSVAFAVGFYVFADGGGVDGGGERMQSTETVALRYGRELIGTGDSVEQMGWGEPCTFFAKVVSMAAHRHWHSLVL